MLAKITLSGDESRLFRELDCLSATPSGQLVEQPGGVRLHGILADEEALGDLAVAEPGGHGFEDLELARRDAELGEPGLVPPERAVDRNGDAHLDGHLYLNGHLAHDYRLARAGELEAEPDPEAREDQRDDAAVDLEGVLEDEVPVLHQLEDGDQNAAKETVDEDGLLQRTLREFAGRRER